MSPLRILALIVFVAISNLSLLSSSLAQDWEFGSPKGTLKVVNQLWPSASARLAFAEGLVTLDKDNNYVPCLAVDWRWKNGRTIDFKLRKGVTFHNGEKFNAEAVRTNWIQYRGMKNPRVVSFTMLSDETEFEIINEFAVRFILPEPDGMVLPKFYMFFIIAPAFFDEHKFREFDWGNVGEAGPWGTGPFKFTKGTIHFGRAKDRWEFEAYEEYWDRRLPKVQKVIFENTLMANRDEAVRLSAETEGALDVINFIRPLDTLKVAKSPFAKIVKNKDDSLLVGFFNQRKRNSKWRDIRLRKALNYAINRNELLKYCAKGNAYNLGGYIPRGAYGYNPELTLYEYDSHRARSLLEDAGYSDGFEMMVISQEAWKLEGQIISRMLERIGLDVRHVVLTQPEFVRRIYHPTLEKPPEEQEWDIGLFYWQDWFAHTGSTFLNYNLLEASDFRWIKYDPAYEKMWKDMARTLDRGKQEEKIRDLSKYVYEQAYNLVIYSPVSLYAVNKEVNFVPHKRIDLIIRDISVTQNHWSLKGQNN
jgi:peptide/nickel transport system substrate-binding protein